MKKIYTTAQGKQVSMDSIRLSNEDTIAVGNMKVNARGDQLGPGGIPEASRQQAVNQYYNLHTPVVSGNAPAPSTLPKTAPVIQMEPSADPLIDEQDSVEVVKPTSPKMRGSLASSVAKSTVVEQELLKPIKQQIKDNGPTRI